MAFTAGAVEAVLTLDRSPFNQGLALARRAAASFEGNRYEATIGEKGADKTAANIERVKRFAASLNGQNATTKIDETGGAKTIGVLDLVKRAVASLSGKNATVDIGENGAAKTVGSLEVVKKAAGSLNGKNISMIVDKDGGARNALSGIASGFANIQPGLLALVTGLPSLVAGVGFLVPVLVSAAAATLQLAAGLSQGLAGAAIIGGTAVISAAAGLGIYAKAVSSTVSASRSAYQALDKNAKKQLEMQRNQILNTRASVVFNKQLDKTTLALTRVQAEIGRRVFPAFTRMTALFTSSLPQLTPPLYRLVDGVTAVGEEFVTTVLKGQRLSELQRLLGFVSGSGIKAAKILTNLGLAALSAVQPVIGPATNLLSRIQNVTAATVRWTNSARGARVMDRVVAGLYKRFNQLLTIIGNLGAGFAGLFSALGANNGISNIMNGLIGLTRQFRNFTKEGSRGHEMIVSFMKAAQPILRALGGVTRTLVNQFFGLANALVHARDKASGMSIVASVLRDIQKSIPPIRRLLQDTFIKLGPELGPLITNLAKLAETFAGQTPALVGFVRQINRVLTLFNKLPTPIKSNIANIVALGAIMKATGAGSILGFGGHLLTVMAITSALRGKTGPAGMAVKALGGAARLAGRAVLFLGRQAIPILSRALLFLAANPVGLVVIAIAALAIGLVYAYRHSATFRRGVKDLGAALFGIGKPSRQFQQRIGGVRDSMASAAVRMHLVSRRDLPELRRAFDHHRGGVVFFGLAFKHLKGVVGSAVAGISRSVRANLPLVGRIFHQVFMSLPRSVRVGVQAVIGIVRMGAAVLNHVLRGDWGGAVRAAGRVFASLPRPVRDAIRIVGGVLLNGAGLVRKVLVGNWGGAIMNASKLWNRLPGPVRGAVRQVVGIVSQSGRVLLSVFRGDWGGAVKGAIRLFASLPAPVQGVIRRVIGVVAGGGRMLRAIFSGDWGGAIRAAIGIINTLFPGASQAISRVVGVIRSGVSSAAGILTGGFRGAVNTALSIVASLPGGVSRALSGVAGLFSGMVSSIKRILYGVNLYSIGQQMVWGLARGIAASAGSVLRALGGVIGGAVKAAKKKLHIKSPSLVFAEMGGQIGAGLAGGILGSRSAVEKAARHLADAATRGASVAIPVVSPSVSPAAAGPSPASLAPARMQHAVTHTIGSLGGVMDAQAAALRQEFSALRQDNARLSKENVRMMKALTRSDYFVTAVDEANYVASTANARRGGGGGS